MTPNTFFRVVRRFADEMHAAREAIRTERALYTLPADIRKDIGWPCHPGERGPIHF